MEEAESRITCMRMFKTRQSACVVEARTRACMARLNDKLNYGGTRNIVANCVNQLNVRELKLGTQEHPETLLEKLTLTKHDYFIDSIFIAQGTSVFLRGSAIEHAHMNVNVAERALIGKGAYHRVAYCKGCVLQGALIARSIYCKESLLERAFIIRGDKWKKKTKQNKSSTQWRVNI